MTSYMYTGFSFRRTVKDKSTGQNVVLSAKDVELIQRMRKGKYVDPSFQEYEVQCFSAGDDIAVICFSDLHDTCHISAIFLISALD